MNFRRFIILLSISIFSIFIISCESTEVPEETAEAEIQEVITPEVIEETSIEPVEEDEVEYVEPVEPVEIDEIELEYLRSINNLTDESVTKQEFTDDKAAILAIIADLSKIMDTRDAKAWKKYIEPESIKYYSNPVNLRNAQKKLPIKTITLNSIDDYFLYVFIPSRKRSRVDEIRYISKTNIKVVQVKEDFSTVVYYYFKKIDDKWYVHLPPV